MSAILPSRARALGRPPRGSRVVQVFGETYEVHSVAGGGEKIFRLDLSVELVPRDDPEANLVHSQMAWEDFEARRARGEVKPGEPRPVKPHIPGFGGGHRV